MTHNRTLIALSLISIVLMAFHLTGDFVLGLDKGAASPVAAIILIVWAIGTLVLDGTRWGYVIMFLGGLMSAGMPFIHMRGRGITDAIGASTLGIFFIWVLFVVGATGSVATILSLEGLWRMRTSKAS
ncbi:MAG: hypothetical protein ABI625_05520 [bacterium]